MRYGSIGLRAGAVAIAASACTCHAEGDSQLWLQDYAELKRAMSVSYANLEFVFESARVDLPDLDRQTSERLGSTSSRGRARKEIESFVAAFDDPHLRVERRSGPPGGKTGNGSSWQLDPTLGTAAALTALGYDGRDLGFDLTVERLSGYEPLDIAPENPFLAGVLTVDDRRFGFVRIAHFGEDGYPRVASELWEGFRSEIGGSCDIGCRWEFGRVVSERLLADLAARARQLDDRGIDALVVDVTGNGGGTDWAGTAPYVLTRVPLDCNASAFVRHEHWSRQLEWAGQRIRSDLDMEDLSSPLREVLERALRRNEELLTDSRNPCDWSEVWAQPDFSPVCSPLVQAGTCANLDGVSTTELRDLGSAALLDRTLRFRFERGAYGGPLIVVTDGRSASATEQFASLLQANGAATVVGSRTTGAGCGYTGRGISVYLENTKLLVRMPDCVRYDGQGTNELAGIRPDIEIDWSRGSGSASTRKLVEALRRVDLDASSLPRVR